MSGDVDGDGELSIADVTALLTLLTRQELSSKEASLADADGDGEVSIADVTALLSLLAK